LALQCKNTGATFIHISTDYVFKGNATAPYQVNHAVSPVNAYGASKLLGEQLAIHNNAASIIIRTSWVYSSFGNNFVKTMLRLMKDRDNLNVVADQQGCPTYAADLASAIMQIIEQPNTTVTAPFIYHYSNTGAINWHQFAQAIAQISNSNCIVHPIASAQYPTPAKRPTYSVMDVSKIEADYTILIPAWQDSLQKCMAILMA
jgi:dTDP-4-dehydrorhamnose reductase